MAKARFTLCRMWEFYLGGSHYAETLKEWRRRFYRGLLVAKKPRPTIEFAVRGVFAGDVRVGGVTWRGIPVNGSESWCRDVYPAHGPWLG